MKFVEKCRFLKLDVQKSKEGKDYFTLTILDSDNESHKFFISEELRKKAVDSNLSDLQNMDCAFEVSKYNNGWSVRLLDFKKVENK